MRQRFKADLQDFFDLLKSRRNFAVMRYGDGEFYVIHGIPMVNIDGIHFPGGTRHPFSKRLRETLNHTEPDFYYFVTCPCCIRLTSQYYLSVLKCADEQIASANLFINANYADFLREFLQYMKQTRRNCVIVSNDQINKAKIEEVLHVQDYLLVSGDVCTAYTQNAAHWEDEMKRLSRKYRDTVFLFALGPLSEILIDVAYQAAPNNVYLDIGSTLDEVFLGRKTRPYHYDSSGEDRDFPEFMRDRRSWRNRLQVYLGVKWLQLGVRKRLGALKRRLTSRLPGRSTAGDQNRL